MLARDHRWLLEFVDVSGQLTVSEPQRLMHKHLFKLTLEEGIIMPVGVGDEGKYLSIVKKEVGGVIQCV